MFASMEGGAPTPLPPVPPMGSPIPSGTVPASPAAFSPPAALFPEKEERSPRSVPWKPLFLVIGALAAIAVAAGLAYVLLAGRASTETPSTAAEPVRDAEGAAGKASDSAADAAVPSPVAPLPTPTSVVEPDMDKDGLSDAQEAEVGTSPSQPDTDADGLFDREEVEVYKTNPLHPDTDGDGFLDGAEVSNGYNPNGPGKLFDVPNF